MINGGTYEAMDEDGIYDGEADFGRDQTRQQKKDEDEVDLETYFQDEMDNAKKLEEKLQADEENAPPGQGTLKESIEMANRYIAMGTDDSSTPSRSQSPVPLSPKPQTINIRRRGKYRESKGRNKDLIIKPNDDEANKEKLPDPFKITLAEAAAAKRYSIG